MLTKTRINLYGCLIMAIVIVIAVLMGGCMTTYTVEKHMQDGSSVIVSVQSFREFEQPQIHYSREGEDVTFDFGAESASTGTSPIEDAIADGIRTGAVVLNPVPGGN